MPERAPRRQTACKSRRVQLSRLFGLIANKLGSLILTSRKSDQVLISMNFRRILPCRFQVRTLAPPPDQTSGAPYCVGVDIGQTAKTESSIDWLGDAGACRGGANSP